MPKHNIMWSKVDVRKRLESHHNYYLLFDEYEGKLPVNILSQGLKSSCLTVLGVYPRFGLVILSNLMLI